MFTLRLAATALWASCALAQSSSTVTLFLPMANQTGVLASVITAVSFSILCQRAIYESKANVDPQAPSATVYALGCPSQSGACAPGCNFDTSVTVTEGVSTLAYTWTDGEAQVVGSGTSLVPDIMTVNCAILGGTSATEAICTGHSYNTTQTRTLASALMHYATVTITAGASKMASGSPQGSNTLQSPTTTGGSGAAGASSATAAGAPAMATLARYAAGVAVGVAAVGLL
ncbi:hypothetical protein LTR85_006844 [Meristemomyces frigidus]|nr:hypothetical protein LTR85_006844 [Meristemomyces frigidus]